MPATNNEQAPKPAIGLAIEVIGRSGSVALVKRNGDSVKVQSEVILPAEIRATTSLTPAIESLLNARSQLGRDLNYVAVATGPGSFTGLRIAVTTAKTLAYAWRLPVVVVDSISAIAASTNVNQSTRFDRMLVGLSAYRGQTFSAWMDRSDDGWQRNGSIECLDRAAWADRLRSNEADFWMAGDAAAFGNLVESNRWAMSHVSLAAGVGRLATERFAHDETIDPMELLPNYFRPSAAEEKSTR